MVCNVDSACVTIEWKVESVARLAEVVLWAPPEDAARVVTDGVVAGEDEGTSFDWDD